MRVKCKECGYVNDTKDEVCKKCFVPITAEIEIQEEIIKNKLFTPLLIKYSVFFILFEIIFMTFLYLGRLLVLKKEYLFLLEGNLYNFIIILYLVITNSLCIIMALNIVLKKNILLKKDIKVFGTILSIIYVLITIIFILLSYFFINVTTTYLILISNTLTLLSLLPYLTKKFNIISK